MQVFKEVKPELPELMIGDGILCSGPTLLGGTAQCLGVVIGTSGNCVTVAQTDGRLFNMRPESVVQVYRNTKILYIQPPQASAISSTE